jgi:hypothetical protein
MEHLNCKDNSLETDVGASNPGSDLLDNVWNVDHGSARKFEAKEQNKQSNLEAVKDNKTSSYCLLFPLDDVVVVVDQVAKFLYSLYLLHSD